MSDEIIVLPRDVTAAGLCMAGAREWAALNGFDFTDFLKNGMPVSTLRQKNCPLGNRACDVAERRVRGASNGQ